MRQGTGLLAAAWEEYRTRGVHSEMSDTGLRDCRRAFYAGAHLLLCDLFNRLSPGDEPTEEDMTMVEDLQDELAEFAVSVVQGRA